MGFLGSLLPEGTRMVVPQLRQRTVRPRAELGTASMLRHWRLGHMIRMVLDFFSSMAALGPLIWRCGGLSFRGISTIDSPGIRRGRAAVASVRVMLSGA